MAQKAASQGSLNILWEDSTSVIPSFERLDCWEGRGGSAQEGVGVLGIRKRGGMAFHVCLYKAAGEFFRRPFFPSFTFWTLKNKTYLSRGFSA